MKKSDRKKELQDMTELTTKVLKKMDGYNVYVCLKVMSGIMANMIVSHMPDHGTEEKTEEVVKMLKECVQAREFLEKMMNGEDFGTKH